MQSRLKALCALTLLAGCADAAPEADEGAFRVQLDRWHDMYSVSPTPSGPTADAERARGAIKVGKGDEPTHAVDGTPLRYTCGAVMIGDSYALTAAHCVSHEDVEPEVTEVTLEMYRPMPNLQWIPATVLTTLGDWFDFQHPALSGYLVDEYSCKVVVRCGSLWGQHQCNRPNADNALLECEGEPGLEHGVVPVAENDLPHVEVFMPWAHEVYNFDGAPGDGMFYDHYTDYPSPDQNIHYFGGGRNKLLPLRSETWDAGDFQLANSKLGFGPNGDFHWTSLIGCHGTSGSPIFQWNAAASRYEVVGPVALGRFFTESVGDGVIEYDQLCQEPSLHGPEIPGMAYPRLEHSQYLERFAECPALLKKGPLFWLPCMRDRIKTHWPELWFPWDEITACPACGVLEALLPQKDQWIRVEGRYDLELPLGLHPGAEYRVSAAMIDVDGGGSAWLSTGSGKAIAQARVDGEGLEFLQGTFTADRSGSIVLEGEGSLSVGNIAVVPARGLNDFDTFVDRAGVGLMNREGEQATVARFAGAAEGGFQALIENGERLVLTREAIGRGDVLQLSGSVSFGKGLISVGVVTAEGETIATEVWSEGGAFRTEVDIAGQVVAAVIVEAVEVDGQLGVDWLRSTVR